MTEHLSDDRPDVFRGDMVQAAACSALDGEPIDTIATRLGLSPDTVLRMLQFPTAPYLAAMTIVASEDAFGTVYDMKRLHAYKHMLKGLPGADRASSAEAAPANATRARRGPNWGRLEFRLAYLQYEFAGETFSRVHIETLLAGMTEGASAAECREAVQRWIDQGKLQAANDEGTKLHFPA